MVLRRVKREWHVDAKKRKEKLLKLVFLNAARPPILYTKDNLPLPLIEKQVFHFCNVLPLLMLND